MATIKTKFRPSTIPGKPGTVYYQICHSSQVRLLSAKIHLRPEYWDADRDCILPISQADTPYLAERRIKIDSDISRLKSAIEALDSQVTAYHIDDIIAAFHQSESATSLSAFFEQQILHCTQNKNLGTANNYRHTLSSIMNFLGGQDIPLTMITGPLIQQYENWLLTRGVTRNSSSFYIRNLRAIYNKAVRQGLVTQTYPFRNAYTGIDHTRKRALSEDTILRLQKLDLDYSRPLALSRDIFIFSFCTRGMSFIDIVFLRKSDISDGVLTYMRKKTRQQLSIRLEPCMETIINRYREQTKDSTYVFPIITASDSEEAYRQYKMELNYHNRKLKRLSEILGEKLSLSSYCARHTWATTARKHNVPISVISAGMGHTSEKTTQIYLASLDNSIIDKANKGILNQLNHVISMQEST